MLSRAGAPFDMHKGSSAEFKQEENTGPEN